MVLVAISGHLQVWSAALALVLGTWLARRFQRSCPVQNSNYRWLSWSVGIDGWLEKAALVFLAVIISKHFIYLLFEMDGGIYTTSPNNFGDLPMHINYIRNIARGATFPFHNAIFAKELLRYPYGMDFYNALWECVGVRTTAHLAITGIVLAAVTAGFLRAQAGWLGLVGFFGGGGWAGWQVLLGQRYIDLESKLAWKNLFLSVLLTQRGTLIAVPAGLCILQLMRKRYQLGMSWTRHDAVAVLVLMGSLSFFHVHSFAAIGFLSILLFAFRVWKWQSWRNVRVPILAAGLGTPYVLYASDFFRKAQVSHWRWGWMVDESTALTSFLFMNWGPYLVAFVLLGVWLARERKNTPALREWLAYLLMFALFMNWMVAPWDWDNIKVLIWPYLGALSLLWQTMRRHARPRLRVASFFALGFSGMLALIVSMHNSILVYQKADLGNSAAALKGIQPNSVFVAGLQHNHPLSYFGFSRISGYPGHLWSHAIQADPVIEQVQAFMRGDDGAANNLKSWGATHVYWGPQERLDFGAVDWSSRSSVILVSSIAGIEIYALK